MHFTVAVIAPDTEYLDDLLEPFDENLEVDAYIACTKDEIIERAKSLKQRIEAGEDIASGIKQELLKATTDEELYQAYIEPEYYEYDEDGNQICRYNPNGQWDWYVLGGRWAGGVPLKDGSSDNAARIKDINFNGNDDTYYELLHRWYELILKSDEPWAEKMKKEYKTADQYAKAFNKFSAAVVLMENEWIDIPDGTDFYETYVKDVNPEYILYLVDCHV